MKETELQSWGRRFFRAGGGEACLFYVVFGELGETPELSRRK